MEIRSTYWCSLSQLPCFLLTFSSHPKNMGCSISWMAQQLSGNFTCPTQYKVERGVFDTCNHIQKGQKSWMFFFLGRSEKWLGGLPSSTYSLQRRPPFFLLVPSCASGWWRPSKWFLLYLGENWVSHLKKVDEVLTIMPCSINYLQAQEKISMYVSCHFAI